MAGAEEQRTQAYCPRCGFIPRVPRTTCPVCARSLVARGPEGIDAKRSPAGALLVLGAGLAIVAGGLVVAVVDSDIDPGRMSAGIPQLVPPDSGVLGITESGGDEKDRRDGEERSGKLEGDDDDGGGRNDDDGNDDDGNDGDGDRARRAVTVDDRRPKDVGDMASTPPLLPPIGSDEPDGGSPVPPLDGAPGMPPPLVPVADIGGDSSGDDSDDRDDDGDRGDGRDGEHTVVLASEGGERRALVTTEEGALSALAIEAAGVLDIARQAADALSSVDPSVPVGVFEACDIPEYDDGDVIAFAGRFDAERKADELLERLRELGFGEDVLFVPDDKADRCPGSELVDDGDGGGDGIDLVDDLPRVASGEDGDGGAPLDIPSSNGGKPEAGPDGEGEETDEDAGEGTPADGIEPDLPGPKLLP